MIGFIVFVIGFCISMCILETFDHFLVPFLITIVLTVGGISIDINGININTGHGEHTGFITAVETNGIIWKTGTVYFKTDTQSSQEDTYCVINTEVKQQLVKLGEEKKQITIIYEDRLVRGLKNCDFEEGGIIVGIK